MKTEDGPGNRALRGERRRVVIVEGVRIPLPNELTSGRDSEGFEPRSEIEASGNVKRFGYDAMFLDIDYDRAFRRWISGPLG